MTQNPNSLQGADLVAASELSLAELLIDHPFAVGAPVQTLPAIEAILQCKRIAVEGGAGFTLSGSPGTGRKSVAKLIAAELTQHFRQLPILQHTLSRLPTQSQVDRWQSLLLSLGNRNMATRTAVLKERCKQTIEDFSRRKGGLGTVVLVLQNFEYLDALEASILLDLRDVMSAVRYRVFFLNIASAVGLPQAHAKWKKSSMVDDIHGLIGAAYSLRHLSTREDFRHLFAEIDQRYFPPGSDCTWLQFYLPRAHAGGLRLEQCVDAFYEAYAFFCDGQRRSIVTTRLIFHVIRIALVQQTLVDKEGLVLGKDVWLGAFEQAAWQLPTSLALGNET